MHRTFNMGIGLIFAVAAEDADAAIAQLSETGETPVRLGHLAAK